MKTTRRTMLKGSGSVALASAAAAWQSESTVAKLSGAVRAVDFESREVYRSAQRPGYTSWVSFFPGEKGQWYLTCEEILRREHPHPRMSREMTYAYGLPTGYDKAPYDMELVILESQDQMQTWRVISREPVRMQHSAGSFGQAKTKSGRFLRFLWQGYSLDPDSDPTRIFYISEDGRTWRQQPPFHDRRLFGYPHRLRTLRDGTLVLALPFGSPWGRGTRFPQRTCMDLNRLSSMQMCLCFSSDEGATWSNPLTILSGQSVAETDFVELPSGDLVVINSSLSTTPGRQRILRSEHGFVPDFFERSNSRLVPETVCLIGDDLLVGCLRNSQYLWSDDLGLTWQPLDGVPAEIARSKEAYQPWMHYLGDGVVVNAGHFGGDDVVGSVDQYLMIHRFRIDVQRASAATNLTLERDFDVAANRWLNRYVLHLTSDGAPLAGQEIDVWFVERDQPGYDSWHKLTLDARMAMGGEMRRVRTDEKGVAILLLPQFDSIASIHHSIQMVALFNRERKDANYKPEQTPMFEFYSKAIY